MIIIKDGLHTHPRSPHRGRTNADGEVRKVEEKSDFYEIYFVCENNKFCFQKKQLQALKTKPEPEKPLIPKRPKDARDAREVARKLIKSGNINISKPESQVQFKRPKGQERKKLFQQEGPASYHPFSTSTSIEDDSSSSKSPLPTPEKADG